MITVLRRSALILIAGALALAVAGLPVLAGSAAPAAPASSAASAPGWRVLKAVVQPGQSALLLAIDAVSANDAWASGALASPSGSTAGFIERWNGSSWQRTALPGSVAAAARRDQYLVTITASSRRNVWAFGYHGYLHLGRAGWRAGRLPRRLAPQITAVASKAFGPRDVWMFGLRHILASSPRKITPIAAKFNGRRWSTVRLPGRGITLSVSALSAKDMWAITGATRHPAVPRIARWNGKAWELAAVQPRLPAGASLDSILALSDRDVWAGGSVPNDQHGTSVLAEHWNGRTWQTVGPPAAATSGDVSLASLAPDSSGGLWAAATNETTGRATFWHCTGGRWVPDPAVRAGLVLPHLAPIPHSASIWAIAENARLTRGLILLHGAVPR